jgi:hypothetical protein
LVLNNEYDAEFKILVMDRCVLPVTVVLVPDPVDYHQIISAKPDDIIGFFIYDL